MNKRYFAVGAAKGWVQIRTASKPPTADTTETTINTKVRHYDWIPSRYEGDSWIQGREVVKLIPKKMKLKVTVHSGGRTIMTVKASQFSRLMNVSVREGGMVELLPEQVEQIKQEVK